MKLTAEAVDSIIRHCLYREDEDTTDHVPIQGVMMRIGFHPGRLAEKRDEIKALLMELPDNFHKDKGGGWSFLNACMDRHDNHWGEHVHVDGLLTLGLATNQAQFMLHRGFWSSLPGGMPYFAVGDFKAEPLKAESAQKDVE